MVKISELLINIVNTEKAKDTERPYPKWERSGPAFDPWGGTDRNTTGEEAGSKPSVRIWWNTENPYRCPFGQADRKEGCRRCGHGSAEKAKAAL
jgi:hypothetical protein